MAGCCHKGPIFLVIVFFIIVGCSSSPQLLNMIPNDDTLIFESTGKSLKVEYSSVGDESNIHSNLFFQALVESLKKSNLFTQITVNGVSDYEISCALLSQDQPSIGIDMTVDLTVAYVIKSSTTGKKLYNKTIHSSFTATFGDALVGVTRLRKANEGAVRENIKQFIKDLSESQLE